MLRMLQPAILRSIRRRPRWSAFRCLVLAVAGAVAGGAGVEASETVCESVIASPAFHYMHTIGTGADYSDPSPLLEGCAVEPHPSASNTWRVTVEIPGDASESQAIVVAYTTAGGTGFAIQSRSSDRPRPTAIEYQLRYPDHEASLASDPMSSAIDVTSQSAGTFDAGLGTALGYTPASTSGQSAMCTWITRRAFEASCAAFDTACAAKAEATSEELCPWVTE